ncbi:hypothetical protein SUGI_0648930 [Cryptomeria japonica]|nr:hypothetical protein SUGI_0648930 [Cryptomeria japonica]
MEALQHLKTDQVFHTIRIVVEDKRKVVDIGRMVFCTSLNSTNIFDPHILAAVVFKDTFHDLMKVTTNPNLADRDKELGF